MGQQVEIFKYWKISNITEVSVNKMTGRFFDQELDAEEYDILKGFYPKARELTIKEIRKNTKYSSYERVNHYLKQLAKKEIVSEKKIGKTLVYSVNPATFSARMGFYLYVKENLRKFASKQKIISLALNEIPREIDVCVIFGSYAKGKETKKSDIDILCVYIDDKEKSESWIASIQRKYNLTIHSVVMPRTEFGKIKNENPAFWEDLLNYGITFKGHELLYYYAYQT